MTTKTTKEINGKKESSESIPFWPYLLSFLLLEILFLVVLTWAIYEFYKSLNCNIDPNIVCYDDWYCENPPSSPSNQCFSGAGSGTTGLASCLYGTGSALATTCFGPELQPDKTLCDCPSSMQSQTLNCFSQCPSSINSVNPDTTCAKK
jgi:hypothetical protein